MKAHRIETTLSENGTLTLKDLPFQAGEAIEVIILERQKPINNSNTHPLRDTVLRYDDPCEPATPLEDWEALQ